MGEIDSGSRENYNAGVGTVFLTGQSVYRGDIALIRMASGNSSYARIYRDGVNSTAYNSVVEKWYRRSAVGDIYCVGGATSGENCGWSVFDANGDVFYGQELVRNVVSGRKTFGTRTQGGDSGASVFTERPDGYIAAKGIHSGGGPTGQLSCSASDPCLQVFTDIFVVDDAFPGTLKLA